MSGLPDLVIVRSRLGITQEELAKLSGVSISNIRNLETGKGDPKISTLFRLSKALNCDIMELVPEDQLVEA